MPLPSSWDQRDPAMQPSFGGVQPPANPGSSGNIPYAPGMMGAYQPRPTPKANDLYQSLNPAGSQPYQPLASGQPPGQQQQPSGNSQMGAMAGNPFQAQGLIDALRRLIALRGSVAATRGQGTNY